VNAISMYNDHIAEIQEEYDCVNSLEPNPPREIYRKLSLGLATGIYEKHLTEWDRITYPVRSAYEFYVDSLRLEEETIEKFHQLIHEMEIRLEEIERLRKDNKTVIQVQSTKIKNIEPQLEALK